MPSSLTQGLLLFLRKGTNMIRFMYTATAPNGTTTGALNIFGTSTTEVTTQLLSRGYVVNTIRECATLY